MYKPVKHVPSSARNWTRRLKALIIDYHLKSTGINNGIAYSNKPEGFSGASVPFLHWPEYQAGYAATCIMNQKIKMCHFQKNKPGLNPQFLPIEFFSFFSDPCSTPKLKMKLHLECTPLPIPTATVLGRVSLLSDA